MATNVAVSARIAVQAGRGVLDPAGAQLSAAERAVDILTPNWLYFSIRNIDAPDHRGPVHRAVPRGPREGRLAR